MNLDERDLKKIKSLHVMLKMPIWILEKETNKVLKSYESIYKHPISYGFKEKNISEETVQFYSGILNEIFLWKRRKKRMKDAGKILWKQ